MVARQPNEKLTSGSDERRQRAVTVAASPGELSADVGSGIGKVRSAEGRAPVSPGRKRHPYEVEQRNRASSRQCAANVAARHTGPPPSSLQALVFFWLGRNRSIISRRTARSPDGFTNPVEERFKAPRVSDQLLQEVGVGAHQPGIVVADDFYLRRPATRRRLDGLSDHRGK